jgi:hypothetical protein
LKSILAREGIWKFTGTESFAQKATSAKWEENGKNTLARRRGGLTSETAVRSIEK